MIKQNKSRYKFDKEKHHHSLDDKPLCGVTTVLSVIAKPALIQWSSNENTKYVLENSDRFFDFKTKKFDWNELCAVLDEAKTAHRKKKEDAGQKGTDVHSEVENVITDGIKTTAGKIGEYKGETEQVKLFHEWAKKNDVKFLESEINVYSEKYWIGGICDFVCEWKGKRYIGDLKTSSGIYPEHFYQIGAYDICLQEMGHQKADGYIVVNTPKTGGIKIKIVDDKKELKQNQDAFLHALGLYKIINNLVL